MEGVEGHADGAHRKAHQHEAQPGAARKHAHSSPPWQTRLLSCGRRQCRAKYVHDKSNAAQPVPHARLPCKLGGGSTPRPSLRRTKGSWRAPRARARLAAHPAQPPRGPSPTAGRTLCDLENAGSGAAPLSGTPLPSIRTTDTDSGRWTDLSRAEPSAGRAAVSCSLSPARERQKSVPRP